MLLLVSRDSPVTSHLWPDSVTETQRPGDSSNSLRGSKLPECPVPSLVSRDTTLSPYWRRRGRDTDLSVHTLHGTTWHIAPSQTRPSIDTGDPSAGVLQHPGSNVTRPQHRQRDSALLRRVLWTLVFRDL